MDRIRKFGLLEIKKVAFDIAMEKDTFFEAKHAIERNPGKLLIIDMPFAFDPSLEV